MIIISGVYVKNSAARVSPVLINFIKIRDFKLLNFKLSFSENSRTCKDLHIFKYFKYFQGLEKRLLKFKGLQDVYRSWTYVHTCMHFRIA